MKKICTTITFKNILFILLPVLIFIISGCSGNAAFSGSKTINDSQFLLDFEAMNTTVSGKMNLSKGESVETVIDINKGEVDITVKNEKNRVAYIGDNIGCSNFTIKIEESGTYSFFVTGVKAQGSIYFIKTLSGTEKEH